MKTITKQLNRKPAAYSAVAATKAGFTIIELLTVMSIIVILIGLLVPALNMAKKYARTVRQKAQLHSIDAAIELFSNEFDGYPPSGAMDSSPTPLPYCGAMKLCEAMMGQDLMGFHTNSAYRRDGMDTAGTRWLYDPAAPDLTSRKGPFLPLENANAYKLVDLYPPDSPNFNKFLPISFVLCDVFTRDLYKVKAGMPILYYRANTANRRHLYDVDGKTKYIPTSPNDDLGNIYNFLDNHLLVGLGKPWVPGGIGTPGKMHKLYEDPTATPPEEQGLRFYINTRNDKVANPWRPYRADSYILISAGPDGEYGTADDICNFEWKYKPLP